MKKLLLIALLIVGCAPKTATNYHIGMSEQEFNKKNPNLSKHAIAKSALGNAAMIIVDAEENNDLPYFYIEKRKGIATWITFGKINAYFYHFDPETDTLASIQLGRDFSEKNESESN